MLAARPILILGAPRSGTTWLAKIFDSHPAVIYRHEPDEISPADPGLRPSAQIALWLSQRGLRTAAKRPHFAKSWRAAPVHVMRGGLAAALSAMKRIPPLASVASAAQVPDFLPARSRSGVRSVIKLVNWDGAAAVRALPALRCVIILRHPCGQVHSILTGRAGRRFHDTPSAAMRAAEARAAESGMGGADFRALPEAGRLAFAWLAFNEGLLRGLGPVPNARLVLYEDLCCDPEGTARDLFSFTGLPWVEQTSRFLQASTRDSQRSGYFDVFRASSETAEKWRRQMSHSDQRAVRAAVRGSELARLWPDLAF